MGDGFRIASQARFDYPVMCIGLLLVLDVSGVMVSAGASTMRKHIKDSCEAL
jgi:hypothetical protein